MNQNETTSTQKLAIAGVLTAAAVAGSLISVPVAGSKCAPVQHMVNVFAAVILGPWWGVGIAFCASLIRNLLGIGSLLAFPGSMFGALCCGLVFRLTGKLAPTGAAEALGTGILGGLAAYPVAKLLMGLAPAGFTVYMLPFFISTFAGSVLAFVLLRVFEKSQILHTVRRESMPHVTNIEVIFQNIRRKAPKIHCLTNPVTMQDVANLLLAAGGSAVMGQDDKEAAEITGFCQGTLLNTGVPDDAKIKACIHAGKEANVLGHPVVLDPVGVGASIFRQKAIKKLLDQVYPDLIRCNQEEAAVLCALFSDSVTPGSHGGVESALHLTESDVCSTAKQTANLFRTTVLITGAMDVVSDGENTQLLTGGDSRICRITGGGCMLSALCTLFLCTADSPFDAACAAGTLWREVAYCAGQRTDAVHGGIGTFHTQLFDVLEKKIFDTETNL